MRSSIKNKSFYILIFIMIFSTLSHSRLKESSQDEIISVLVLELNRELEKKGIEKILEGADEQNKDFKDRISMSLKKLKYDIPSSSHDIGYTQINGIIEAIESFIQPGSILSTIQAISQNTSGMLNDLDKELFEKIDYSYRSENKKNVLKESYNGVSLENISPVFKQLVSLKNDDDTMIVYQVNDISGNELIYRDVEGKEHEIDLLIDLKEEKVNIGTFSSFETKTSFPRQIGDLITFSSEKTIIIPSSASLGGGISFSENAYYILSGEFTFSILKYSDNKLILNIFPGYRLPQVYGMKYYEKDRIESRIFRINERVIDKDKLFFSYIIDVSDMENINLIKNIFKERLKMKNVPDFQNTTDSFLANEKMLSLIGIEDLYQKERGLDTFKRKVSRSEVNGSIVPDYGLDSKLKSININNGDVSFFLEYTEHDGQRNKLEVNSRIMTGESEDGVGNYRDKDIEAYYHIKSGEKQYFLVQKNIFDTNCLKNEMKKDVYCLVSSSSVQKEINMLMNINRSFDVLMGYRLRNKVLYSLQDLDLNTNEIKRLLKDFTKDLSEYIELLSNNEKKRFFANSRVLLKYILEKDKDGFIRELNRMNDIYPDINIFIFLEYINVLKKLSSDVKIDAKGIDVIEVKKDSAENNIGIEQLYYLLRFF